MGLQREDRTTTDRAIKDTQPSANLNATRVVASSFAALARLTCLIAGYFEMHQRGVAPEGLWISYIGPSYANWRDFTNDAFTVMPPLFLASVTTITISLMIVGGFAHDIRRQETVEASQQL